MPSHTSLIRYEASFLEQGLVCPFRSRLRLIRFLDHSLCNIIATQHTSIFFYLPLLAIIKHRYTVSYELMRCPIWRWSRRRPATLP